MSNRKKQGKRPTLADQLRVAINESGLPHNFIARETGVAQPIITRFVNGTRSISLENADKVAAFFSIRLTRPRYAKRD